MSKRWRVSAILAFFAMVMGLAAYGTRAWVLARPPDIDFASGHARGQPVNLVMQTVAQMGKGHEHVPWVSYLIQNPSGQWVHTTVVDLPAHTRINVKLYQFDGGGELRNEVLAHVTGTIDGTMAVNGTTMNRITTDTLAGETHTFTVPGLGLNVPLVGVNGSNPTFCKQAPCSLAHIHNTITFSFMSGAPAIYHWQCFFPCAAGYLDGNGGPMQTLGFMDGFLKVQPYPGHPLDVGQ